jgi:hypothetical protein
MVTTSFLENRWMTYDPRRTFAYRLARRLAWALLPEAGKRAILCSEILEFEMGHWATASRWASLDGLGQPIPWISYPAISFLEQRDLAGCRVFEFGTGNSTLYWLRRGASVDGVEHDPVWHARAASLPKGEADRLKLVEDPKRYPQAIRGCPGRYDIILVDGIERLACAREALKKLKRDGMIILDNSDWHPRTAALLRRAGLVQVDFSGFSPINAYVGTTSFFLGRGFRNRPAGSRQPIPQPGSISQVAD